ncbi:MAG: hypothetical protein WCW26_05565 [Candidatus Buchananbacteria bacterium]
MDFDTKTIAKGKRIGKITHYFNKVGVAVLELEQDLQVGEVIVVCGHGHEFEQKVDSMQMEHESVLKAKAGDIIALKTDCVVSDGCIAYLKG